jgi:hypothetical protein
MAAAFSEWPLTLNPTLHEQPEAPLNSVLVMYSHADTVDRLRPALAHLVYVEANPQHACGIVQFFGVLQVYCELPLQVGLATPEAYCGVLDPITGSETFGPTTPLCVSAPPLMMPVAEMTQGIQSWLEAFTQQAVARGATHPPALTARVKTDILIGPNG